jgi:ABC-type uncharacterized transport system permease subunit
MRKVLMTLAAPVGALVLTLVISSLALWVFGSNPFAAYGDMVGHAAKLETQVDIWNRATPLYLSAIAASIGFRMNLFNIGVEGWWRMGWPRWPAQCDPRRQRRDLYDHAELHRC